MTGDGERADERQAASTADILRRSTAITNEFDNLLKASEELLRALKRDDKK